MKILLAYSTFFVFVPFAFYIFKRFPRAQAAAIVVLVGSILLPEQVAIDLPAIPPIDKEYLTYLTTLIAAFVYRRSAILRARPGIGLEVIVVAMFFANIATAQMNSSPFFDEGKLEDALGIYWIVAYTMDDLLIVAVPFFVGRALFTSLDDLYVFMSTLVIAAVGYTGLIAIETLLSIPFRSWQFAEVLYSLPARLNMRWGMAQPVVFFDNGLALATFMAVALIASAAILKSGLPIPRVGKQFGLPRIGSALVRNILIAGMIMTLNVAGIVYGMTFMLAHALLRPRIILLISLSLIALGGVYPSLRMGDLFPYEAIVDFARDIDADRARSLEGRFFEEEHVLSQIGNRLWVGWGTISRVPGAETFGTGEVGLDGWWTIRMGMSGILGVGLYYVVLAVPVIRAFFLVRLADRAGGILIGGVMCMISIRMMDLIINGWWNCLPIFLAGVLAGVVGNLKRGDRVGGKPRPRTRPGSDGGAPGGPGGRDENDPPPSAPPPEPASLPAGLGRGLTSSQRSD